MTSETFSATIKDKYILSDVIQSIIIIQKVEEYQIYNTHKMIFL
ncbi:hypothetical protein RCZ04_03680 [Capnocytophaga sp. HP1101]